MADDLDAVCCEIKIMWETQDDLKKELESLQKRHEQYKTEVIKAFQEGKEKYSALEQKLINTKELFEGNFSDMKEDLICIQDEIDNKHQETYVTKALENCHTRLLHLEQEQQQQALQTETARPKDMALAVLELVIRVLLVFMSITLNLVTTLSHIVLLLKPSGRIRLALVFAIILHFTWKYWDSFSVLELP
ncbi:transmembrane and coiled-coil domains protein 2-like [Nothobranchius furzeri]|uniref:transmembrane and coiled-coil domains protein 2-like n=1 Tax=Nothobranchius furzeri TaxID=105023 RepID=UPI003904C405